MTDWTPTNTAKPCPVCGKYDGLHDRWCEHNPYRPDRLQAWLGELSEAYDRIDFKPVYLTHEPYQLGFFERVGSAMVRPFAPYILRFLNWSGLIAPIKRALDWIERRRSA